MKIAIPVTDDLKFSTHYGASTALTCFAVDESTRALCHAGVFRPSNGTPCSWPDRLPAAGITVLLVGDMGAGAQDRCAHLGIQVIDGVLTRPPAELAAGYLEGTLTRSKNACGPNENKNHHGHTHPHTHANHCHCEN